LADFATPATFVTPSINALSVNQALPSATFDATHGLLPLALGIGCKRGVALAQIEAAVQRALGDWPLARVTAIATLDAKADEPALRAFCAAHALPLHTYTREQLAATPTLAPPSAAARAQFGVDGVCEPCARLAANGGPLVRGKLALDGVTVAIASVSAEVLGA
jgi:cobalamin biosynthesis protein CbiG